MGDATNEKCCIGKPCMRLEAVPLVLEIHRVQAGETAWRG